MSVKTIIGKIENADFDALLSNCPGERSPSQGALEYQVSNFKDVESLKRYVFTIEKYSAGTNVYTLSVSAKGEEQVDKILEKIRGKLNMEEIDKDTLTAIIKAREFYV